MSKRTRIIRNIAIGLAAFIVIVAVALAITIQTDWFREFVKSKIIAATEEGTGGRAEIGSFTLDWRHLRAVAGNFVIHGKELAGSPPWIAVKRAEVDLRLIPNLDHGLDLSYLALDQPAVTILVSPDGSTNIPTPKQPSTSNETTTESLVDLAVGHFELTNGSITFNSRKQRLNVQAENLRAQLAFSTLKQSYQGQISLQPIYVISGRNTPVKFTVSLPLVLARDRIDIQGARISTPASEVSIDASMKDMRHPVTSAHVTGRLALSDLKNCANLPIDPNLPALSALDFEANATVAPDAIQVTRLHLALGHSSVDASGNLKDVSPNRTLVFQARLVLGELGRLARVEARPDGLLALDGTARLDPSNNYQLTGNLAAKNLSFQSGASRISGVGLVSDLRLDPHRLDFTNLRLDAWGAEVAGKASLEDFARFQLHGDLRHLDLRFVAAALGLKDFAYSGIASGPLEAAGDLKQPGVRGVTAQTRIAIAPGRRGIPMSGRLYANYNGARDDVLINDSYIALPHSRLTLAGSAATRLNVGFTTRNLDDLLGATPPSSRPSLAFAAGGQAMLNAVITGGLGSPHISAQVSATRLRAEGRQFDALALDAAASSTGATVSNGRITRGTMQARFAASVGLRKWKLLPNEPVSSTVTVRNADLADVMALADQPVAGYTGALSADVKVSGTAGNPLGSANLSIGKGTIHGEPFDQVQGQVNLSDRLIAIPAFYATSGPARINLTADFEHPRDSFSTGRIHAHVHTANVNLAQFQTIQKQLPDSSGDVQLQADVTGNLGANEFRLTTLSADASARNLHFRGEAYGDLTATAQTRQQTVSYDVASTFAGSKIGIRGNTELTADYPTTADGSIGNLPIDRVLRVAGRTGIPAKGNLSSTFHFAGTLQKPEGSADFNLTNAVVYDEPIDHVKARIAYAAQRAAISDFEIVSGPSSLTLDAQYDHPAGNLQTGDLRFQVKSSRIDLARIHNVQKIRPGLGGTVEFAANGDAKIQPAGARVLFHALDANLAANGIAAQGKSYGDLKLTADTTGGRLNFALDSNLAQSSIHGKGSAELSGDYPVNANLTFNNVSWTHLAPLVSPDTEPPSFDASVDGEATVNGPVARTSDLSGSLKLTKVNLAANGKPAPGRQPVVIQNQGPILVSLSRGTVRVDSFHLTGPDTDLQAHGTAAIDGQTLDLTVNANTNLSLARRFDRDVISSGSVVLAATVRGAMRQPLVNGKLELHDASVNYTKFPNGLSHANGIVQFNGNNASLQNITAESGGGKVILSGFVAFREELRFGLRVKAANVRVLPQEGISAVFDANLNISGTPHASIASGSVTVTRLNYAPQSDIGAILTRAAPPVENAATPVPILDNMKLDVQVRTATSMAVRAAMAHNLELDANLQVRGTASQPGLLGRVTVTEGQLVFFNSTYTVNTGTISFYNPVRIEPMLNLSLNTQAQGVDVVLKVTGPIDNMKLTYTSNPPLQFQEIIGLLAAGQTPTSDPVILANQPAAPPQTFTQMGESAVMTQALANPVASRLQRVFGISQISLDPVFASGSELPEARIGLTQRISSNMTFTYVTALNAPNTQIVRAQWTFNEHWGTLATRDEFGIVSVRLTYRRQIR